MAQYFPPRPHLTPWIYAYSNPAPAYKGLLKVGYTTRFSVEERIKEQFNVEQPEGLKPYRIEFKESAMRSDGSAFTDKDVHRILEKAGFARVGGEWFRCHVEDIKAAVLSARHRMGSMTGRTLDFGMRPEQQAAVDKTAAYFQSVSAEGRTPKFLWNCKMRFGKTFAAYQLAKKMGMKRVLVLTFKPAVLSAWEEDLATHLDFEDWQFIARNTELTFEKADKSQPIVCFGSFQDFLVVNRATGGIKPRNE